ncbi:hypothetical protein PUN28_020211 [Cardiocondyla obscurior]|uniref:Ribosomal protein S7 n=1 Tax=Cardiocondyla obscurior TaxID=286306 RepID=A0AAW2E9F6_9HYME
MAKKKKNIFEILQRSIVRQLKIDAYGPIPSFYFHQKPRYGQKQKNILKIYNVALSFYFHQNRDMAKNEKNIFEILQRSIVRHLKRCIRAYSEPLFSPAAEISKNEKNIFENLQRSIVRQLKKMHTSLFGTFYFHQKPRYGQKRKKIFLKFYNVALYGQKTKKIFLKFNNIALCGIQNRCIWAYSSFYFHQKPRYGQKTKKNIFEILQRSIVRH